MQLHKTPFEDSDFASLFSKLRKPVASKVAEMLIQLASIRTGDSLLDLGSGPGLITEAIMRGRLLRYALLVDSSNEMVKRAKKNLSNLKNREVIRANLDFPELKIFAGPSFPFDHVIAMDLWHLLENRRKLAKLIATRLLAPDGNFTIAIHREISEKRMKEWHEFRRDVREKMSDLIKETFPHFAFGQRSKGATVHRNEASLYLSELSRCGLKLSKSRSDRSLADINQMVHHLPESFAIEVKRHLPEISASLLKKIVRSSLREALKEHKNILRSPIAEEVFYVFKKS